MELREDFRIFDEWICSLIKKHHYNVGNYRVGIFPAVNCKCHLSITDHVLLL